ncbi:hypothetical protein TGAMA5MH_06723 [Trichoderma gamsii]|nr:hypothetical protein TGAMA5MH_06723 [Trichoderma gamsii]
MHLNTYFANISRCEREILVRIEYDIDDKSIGCEESTGNLMNNVKDISSAAEWWQYALAFSSDNMTKELDMWKRSPGSADGAADGLFVWQHLEVANSPKHTNQGKIIIAGAPGSGKPLFRTTVVKCVVKGGVVTTSST